MSPGNDTQALFSSLKELLIDINDGGDCGEVTLDTQLVDLGLESISLVYLLAELKQMSVGDVVNSLQTLVSTSGAAKRTL
jgi:aryl carrier-like protein